MKFVARYLLIFFKLPAFLYARLFNFISLKAANIRYSSYPAISGKLLIKGKGEIVAGKDLKINSGINSNPVGLSSQCILMSLNGARISIGDNVGISNSLICAMQLVTIESDVLIGGGTQVFDNDFHSVLFKDRCAQPDTNICIKPVLIKRGAFIGCNCIIGKGVTIGERSIVAAGSVITRNVPADEIWGGCPAVFIKKIDNI